MSPTYKLVLFILTAACMTSAAKMTPREEKCKQIAEKATEECGEGNPTDEKVDVLFLSVNVDTSTKRNANIARKACDRVTEKRTPHKATCDEHVEQACAFCQKVYPPQTIDDACVTTKRFQARLNAQLATEKAQCDRLATIENRANGTQLMLGTGF